jgi:hypothetical protein
MRDDGDDAQRIVRVTYDMSERLNHLKLRCGLIDDRTFAQVQHRRGRGV